ncbi:MAG: D-2-hydroxyacid dehydrogenase [Bacteroidetes bacterium]|nr:D-2-hydroxyacid dehydrogenase [Bacteroidota bacterium]
MRILANDGLEEGALFSLQEHGFDVIIEKVPQENLIDFINSSQVRGLLVRSATKVRKEIFDACPNLSFVGRGGVGMDNIDVAYGRSLGRTVTNTPASSTRSVAELVFAHLFSVARFLHHSNRVMPVEGQGKFEALKKSYAQAFELKGKTLGIIGFGRIGQEVAQMAMGLGMKVLPYDPWVKTAEIEVDFLQTGDTFTLEFETVSLDELLQASDAITLHVPMPANGNPLLSAAEFSHMKPGAILINTARGGIVNEKDLLVALDSGRLAFACLDVFENEPSPLPELLNHTKISVSPHVGGSTAEAQTRIGQELVDLVIDHFRA